MLLGVNLLPEVSPNPSAQHMLVGWIRNCGYLYPLPEKSFACAGHTTLDRRLISGLATSRASDAR